MHTCPRCGSNNTYEGELVSGGQFIWVHCNSCDHDWQADNPFRGFFQ